MGLIELLRETATGVMGDGTAATAAKGQAFVEEAANNLVDVVRWFRSTERTARGYARQTPPASPMSVAARGPISSSGPHAAARP
jgi:hypothetical protein